MKVGIIGGGSIGLLLSCYLSELHEITLYVRRQEQKAKIEQEGLLLDNHRLKYQIKVSLISDIHSADMFLICVKQNNVQHIVPYIQLYQNVPIVFFQNGMGHISYFEKMNHPIFLGVIEHGAYRVDSHHVEHTGRGKIKIAPYTRAENQLEQLINKLSQNNFPIIYENDWYKMMSEKLIINAVINPLTAVFNVKNKNIVTNPYIKHLAKMICKETAMVLRLDFDEQWEKVKSIARKTGNNYSSMLSDLQTNRPTEINAITGHILSLNHTALPYSVFIYNSVRAIEREKGIHK